MEHKDETKTHQYRVTAQDTTTNRLQSKAKKLVRRRCQISHTKVRGSAKMHTLLMPRLPKKSTRVGARFEISLDVLSENELELVKNTLTMQPIHHFGVPPPPFEAWEVDEEQRILKVPRFFGLERFGPPVEDQRSRGDAISITFTGTLTSVQTKASSLLFSKHFHEGGWGGAMVGLACGMGKTVLGVHTVATLGRRACILVHKAVLRDQWKASFERFCPEIKVGFLQGPTVPNDDDDIVIAMVMTVARREWEDRFVDSFGTVVVDEAHHMAARVTNRALGKFKSQWILGLTATKERSDGMTPLLHWDMGPEAFRAEREPETVLVSVATYPNAVHEIVSKGQMLISVMLNKLCVHAGRNAFIADRIASYRASKRVILVLSDRLKQLECIRMLLLRLGIPEEDIGVFKGGMKDKDRVEHLGRPVVLCSYGMANEGVDKVEADTCVMASPKSNVVQCIGRIQRPCATKQTPLVLDVADAAFSSIRWKRHRLYKEKGYVVQILSHDAPHERWHA